MITFKIIKEEDIDTIIQMMVEFYTIDNYPIDIDVSKLLFQEFIDDEKLGKAYLICHSDEGRISEIIGYVILTFIFSFEYKGRIAFLDELFIKEIHRGKGIGNETIQFVKQEAKQLNVKLIYLEVENHNQKAQNLYLGNGFETHNRKLLKYKLT